MNNKKKMVLGAAFIVAILALAGVGYAAAGGSYKGTTDSVPATYDVDYVIVKVGQNGYTAPTNLYITYDTSTVSGAEPVTTFTWLGSTSLTHDITIEVPADYTANNQDRDTFVLTAETASSIVSGYKLQYKLSTGNWTDYSTGSLSSTGIEVAESGTSDDVTILWRAVPNSNDITTQDGNVPIGTSVPTDDGGKVVLPAITYTVTATQHTV